MNINIFAKNIDHTEAVDAYVQEKMSSCMKMYRAHDASLRMYVELEKTSMGKHHGDDLYRASVTMETPEGIFSIDTATADLYAAIDMAKDELLRVLTKNRTKKRDLFRRGMTKIKKILRLS